MLASRQGTDADSIRAQYVATLTGLLNEQKDPLTREALEALIAFVQNPGELIVEVRPPQPLSLFILASMATAKPEQLRQILGIKITAKAP